MREELRNNCPIDGQNSKRTNEELTKEVKQADNGALEERESLGSQMHWATHGSMDRAF